MPQLVKGGKHVYGWSTVAGSGSILIPGDAAGEYGFSTEEPLMLIKGSRTSGGFAVTCDRLLSGTPLAEGGVVHAGHPARDDSEAAPGGAPDVTEPETPRREALRFTLPAEAMERFGVRPGDRLLVVRGSGRALGFLTRGPIRDEALKHDDLPGYG